MTFQNKTFLVTGGANGIGFETARLLKQRGARVVLWDVDENAVQQAAGKIEAEYGVADVTQPEMIQRELDVIRERNGKLDGVVHCAGIARGGLFEQVPLQQHRKVVEINLFGTLAVAYTVLPLLRESKGSLVLISSVSAFYGPPEFSSYAASKAGVLNFAQLLRIELTGSGVHLGVICPHFVDTALYRNESTKAAVSRANPLFIELLTAERIAQVIVRGIEKRQFMMWSSWKSRMLYLFSRYGDFIAHRMMAKTWMDALR
jgi:NAD(P)-dependent dehydrogenase (short-subunit alcohol dehydrogenase family)